MDGHHIDNQTTTPHINPKTYQGATSMDESPKPPRDIIPTTHHEIFYPCITIGARKKHRKPLSSRSLESSNRSDPSKSFAPLKKLDIDLSLEDKNCPHYFIFKVGAFLRGREYVN